MYCKGKLPLHLRAPCLKLALLCKIVLFSYSLHSIVTLQRMTKILMNRINDSSKRRPGGRNTALDVLTSNISLVFFKTSGNIWS